MALFDNKLDVKLLFTAKKPPETLKKYVGRRVTIPGHYSKENEDRWIMPFKVKIESVVGNRFKPQFYEINGKYLVGMLRFHAEMLNDKSITEEQFKAFEEMEIEAVKNPPPTLDDKPRAPGETEQ